MNTSTRTSRIALTAAIIVSAIAAALGLVWLILPDISFFRTSSFPTVLVSLFGPSAATVVHTLVALLGVVTGILALSGAIDRRVVFTVGILQTLVFGIGFGSMAALSTPGYLVAMAIPLLLLAIVVQVFRAYPLARWIVGLPVLLLAGIGIVLGREPLVALIGNLGFAMARFWVVLLVTLLFITIGFVWAGIAVMAIHGTETFQRATRWVTRHRRTFTLIAACGPLPYGLARLTWLTPWPILGAEAAADLPTRIQGLLLSGGCWLAVVLTIGLIRPWGEIFPRWVPVVAGRRVPVAAALVPGGAAAAMLCFAAVPFLLNAAAAGPMMMLISVIAFPCWFWGPALALAVWGYFGHRRASEGGAGGSEAGPTTSTHGDSSAVTERQ